MTVASVAAGSITVVVTLPSAPSEMVFCDQELKGGRIKLWMDSSTQLLCELYDTNNRCDFVSSTIKPYNPGFNTVTVTWSKSKIELLVVGGNVLYPEGANFAPPLDGIGTIPQRRDFSKESIKAKNKRKHRLDNFARDPKRIPGGEGYVFSALAAEVDQLEDLIAHITAGSKSHVVGLMARVRLCTIGKPLGLLQVCAAYLDADLKVYTAAQAGNSALHGPVAQVIFDVSAEPNELLSNPVDFDAWLDLNGLFYGGRSYPNREVIREIGNTVAAHIDMDIQPSVFFLRSGKTAIEIELDYMSLYSVKVASVILYLAKHLLILRSYR